MGRKKVIRTEETLEGADLKEQEEKDEGESESKQSKKKSKKELDLSSFIKGLPSGEDSAYVVRVRRVTPSMWKGRRLSGLLGDFPIPFDPILLKEEFGGGKYQMDVIDARDGKSVFTSFEEITGDPKIEVAGDKNNDDDDPAESALKKRLKTANLKHQIKTLKELDEEDSPQDQGSYIDPQEIEIRAARRARRMMRRENQNNGTDSLAKLLTALVPLIKPQPQDNKNDKLLDMLIASLINKSNNNQGITPKDIMGLMTPMMSEFMRGQSEVRKMEVGRIGEINQVVMEKMIESLKISGAPEDEVDKIRKWMPIIQEGLGLVKNTFVPQRLPPKGYVKRLPQINPPVTPGGKPIDPNSQTAINPGMPNPTNPPSPEEVAGFRVTQFLTAIDIEMTNGSDPDAAYDEGFETAFYTLPVGLRNVILTSNNPIEIFAEISKYADPNVLETIKGKIISTPAYAEWMNKFLDVVKIADEERNKPEEDEAGEQKPEEEKK